MNTWKQSTSNVRVITVGLKVTLSPPLMLALAFFSRQWCVSVRLSCCRDAAGLNFGVSPDNSVFAFRAHLCGSLHPFRHNVFYTYMEWPLT